MAFFDGLDADYMAQAVCLADRGRYGVCSNPKVGAILVKDNHIVGKGWHVADHADHAEVMALKQAGSQAQGAVCYTTLEPCCHIGKNPSCAHALAEAGVIRVVIATSDPNPLVDGGGKKVLQDAGIQVDEGLQKDQAVALNPGFNKRMLSNMPHVRLKMAMSLDGRTAMGDGNSYWISSPHAREDVQLLRAESGAIISSAKSVMRDASRLNIRREDIGQVSLPLRVILDYQDMLTGKEEIFKIDAPIIVVSPSDRDFPTLKPKQEGRVDLCWLLEELAKLEINNVLIEAGHTLAGAFISQALVDEVICYMAPKIMGNTAMGVFGINITSMNAVLPMRLQDMRMVGQDIKLTLTFERE